MKKGQSCQIVTESGSLPLPALEAVQLLPAEQEWDREAV